ncbi:hypothetical protein ABH908_000109 [Pseudomonas frederiksbergensis]|uniref:hypothetical protein n=1 Tax=Pseudomonas TaxID=286 RepID=UPI003D246EDC
MSKPSGLIVFESADEIQVKIEKSTPVLSATGFYWALQDWALCLTSGVEDSVRPGFDAPLAYVQSGSVESCRKQLWFKTRDAADILIRRIEVACSEQKVEQKVSLTPYQESFQSKVQSFVGTCVTAVFVCFLGAGAANLGWKTSDPLATSLAGAHQSGDQEQARIVEEAYHRIIPTDSLASMKKMLDVERLQQQKFDAYQGSLKLAQMQADEVIKNDIQQDYEKLFAQEAQEAQEEANKKMELIMQKQQLLPEQEPQDQ